MAPFVRYAVAFSLLAAALAAPTSRLPKNLFTQDLVLEPTPVQPGYSFLDEGPGTGIESEAPAELEPRAGYYDNGRLAQLGLTRGIEGTNDDPGKFKVFRRLNLPKDEGKTLWVSDEDQAKPKGERIFKKLKGIEWIFEKMKRKEKRKDLYVEATPLIPPGLIKYRIEAAQDRNFRETERRAHEKDAKWAEEKKARLTGEATKGDGEIVEELRVTDQPLEESTDTEKKKKKNPVQKLFRSLKFSKKDPP